MRWRKKIISWSTLCVPLQIQSWSLLRWNQLRLSPCSPLSQLSWMAFWSNCQPLEQRQTNNDIITLKLIRGFAEFYVKFKFSKSEVLKAVDKSISVSVNLFKNERIGRILQKRTMHHVILSFLTSYSSSSLYEKNTLLCSWNVKMSTRSWVN